MSRIAVFGGAHLDRRGRISGETAPGASNPGTWFEEPGGGALNAARTLARLGHQVRLVSARGGDEAGERVGSAAEASGVIDCPVTFLDRRTPSYTAILARNGDLIVAIADMDLYQLMHPRRLARRAIRDIIEDADTLLMDANLPPDTLNALAEKGGGTRCVAAIAISPAKVVRYRDCLASLDFLFMNRAEAHALTGETSADGTELIAALRARGLRGGAITDGAAATFAFRDSEIARVTPPVIEAVSDVTGAGDALAAGFLHGVSAGLPLEAALRHGVAAAAITVRSPLAVADDMSPASLSLMLAGIPF
ncbi:carbohydrate kinase family protein [Ensifer soli]|uniref:carbohydrate kinase family protein n=1 Tax=Ciceribacter sp. sgz301302 TaxID=3342379 RepID=UPI0035B87588